MSQAPAMPVFTDALIGDTTHLSTIEFGAYCLILFATWRNNGKPLPDDDLRLMRVTRMKPAEWRKARPILAEFFDITDGFWHQKRLEKEWIFVQERAQKSRENGRGGGRPKSLNSKETENPAGSFQVTQTITQTEPRPNLPIPIPKKEEENPPSSPHGGNGADVIEKPRRSSRKAVTVTDAERALLDQIWAAYPNRGGAPNPKGEALARCLVLAHTGQTTLETLLSATKAYAGYCRRTSKEGEVIQQAVTFFGPKKETWKQYAEEPGGLLQGMTAPPVDFERWKNRAEYHRKTGKWQQQWGALPGDPACQCPAELLNVATA